MLVDLQKTIAIIKQAIKKKCQYAYIKKTTYNLQFLQILFKEGYIIHYELYNNNFKIFPTYLNNKSPLQNLKILSTPGHKQYITYSKLQSVFKPGQEILISTNRGLIIYNKLQSIKEGGLALVAF